MKPILIDDLMKGSNTQAEVNLLTSGGVRMRGWKIAKPLNYNLRFRQRIQMAMHVLRGKAIAVRYFEDMKETEIMEYARNNLKK